MQGSNVKVVIHWFRAAQMNYESENNLRCSKMAGLQIYVVSCLGFIHSKSLIESTTNKLYTYKTWGRVIIYLDFQSKIC